MKIRNPYQLTKRPKYYLRILYVLVAVVGLSIVYLSQSFNYFAILLGQFGFSISEQAQFIFNKSIRYLLNDSFCLLLIYGIFLKKSYVLIGLYVEIFGLLILLPIYFLVKLQVEGPTELSSPMLSFIHRLVINPTLMLMLIVGLFYQQQVEKSSNLKP